MTIGIIILTISCFWTMRHYRLEQQKHDFIGIFKLDMDKSDFGGLYPDSNVYSQLTLSIKEDGTFEFSEHPHFLFGQKGNLETGRKRCGCLL